MSRGAGVWPRREGNGAGERPSLPRALLAAAAAAALLACPGFSGCAGPRSARQAYLEAHPELDPRVRDLIAQGRVEEGMSREQVQAALGPPDSRRAFEEPGGTVEVWTYPGALVVRRITRTATDLDYRVRLIFRGGTLERIEDL